jgi:hypothetical protein
VTRDDGLPGPETVGESFLAAILQELRDIKATLHKPDPPKDEELFTKVKEPKRR